MINKVVVLVLLLPLIFLGASARADYMCPQGWSYSLNVQYSLDPSQLGANLAHVLSHSGALVFASILGNSGGRKDTSFLVNCRPADQQKSQ